MNPDPVLTGSGSGLFSEVGSGPNRSGSATLATGNCISTEVEDRKACTVGSLIGAMGPAGTVQYMASGIPPLTLWQSEGLILLYCNNVYRSVGKCGFSHEILFYFLSISRHSFAGVQFQHHRNTLKEY